MNKIHEKLFKIPIPATSYLAKNTPGSREGDSSPGISLRFLKWREGLPQTTVPFLLYVGNAVKPRMPRMDERVIPG